MTLDEALRVAIEDCQMSILRHGCFAHGYCDICRPHWEAAAVLERLRAQVPILSELGATTLRIADDAIPVRGEAAHASLFNILRMLGDSLQSLDPPAEERA